MFGYRGKSLQWVKSYTMGRTTRVKVETRMSKPVITRKGIPQWGRGSLRFCREYTKKMIMTIHESDQWADDDKQNEITTTKTTGRK